MYKKSGIYIITNLFDGTVYLGRSDNIFRRWGHHYNDLMKGTHHCCKLQEAWSRDGEDCFIFTVYRPCSPDKLVEQEKACWAELSGKSRLYNITFRENHRPGALLSDNEVRAVKIRLKDGEKPRVLADLYGVSVSTIRSIKQGRTYVDISV